MNMNVNNEHGCDEYAKPAKSSSTGTGKIKVMALDKNFQRRLAVPVLGWTAAPDRTRNLH
jgi:hypothetical protein